MPNGYGYTDDDRPDPPARTVPSGTPPSSVKQPPGAQARGQTRQSKEGVLREIRDRQNPPVTRVIIGKLGPLATDWGIQVFDQNGDLVLNASGEVGLVAGLLQDPAGHMTIDLDNTRITILDSVGRKRVEIGDLVSGTFGIQIFDADGTLVLDEQGTIGQALNRGGTGQLLTILKHLQDGGQLGSGMTQETVGTQRLLARGTQTGRAADGDVVSFSEPFSQPPVVIVVPSGRSYRGGLGDVDQWLVMKANGLDENGFTMKAVVQERSASVLQTEAFPAGTCTFDGDTVALGGLTDDAVDDEYSVEYTFDFTLNDGGGSFSFSDATYTVHIDAKDGAGSWVEKSSKQYFLTASKGSSNSTSGTDAQSFSDADIGSGDDIRVRLSIDLNCGTGGCSSSETVDPTDVEYNVATVTEHTMSPNGETLSFIAFEGL